MGDTFRGLLATGPGVPATLHQISLDDLPAGDVLVKVRYSSLNYKDALAVLGRPGVIKKYPMVPGIDFAGDVVSSESSNFKPGDAVFLTGWGMGESRWGGYAECARVKSDWLLPVPQGLTHETSMAFGTAGLTAMLAIQALEKHGVPKGATVLVTGAGGGVGSLSLLALSHRGYNPVAVSGRPELRDYLLGLGASEVLAREDVTQNPRSLGKERWVGAIDSVGGSMLSAVLSQTARGGCVAACGLAGSQDLQTTVFPFILRGITLAGIDSVRCPTPIREQAWSQLATVPNPVETMAHVHPLEELPGLAEEILTGKIRGRVVVQTSG